MFRKIFKNKYVFSIITKFTLVFFGLFNTVFINRYLGPSLKGEYAYILNIVNIVVLVLNLGIYQSYPYFKRKQEAANIKNKFYVMVMLQFSVYFLIALISSLLLKSLDYIMIFTLVPLMILSKQLMFIVMIENINLRNILNIGNQIFYTVMLFFVFIFAPQNYLIAIALLYIKDIVIILRIITKFGLKLEIRNFDFTLLKKSIRFGFYPMLTALLITMNYKFDIILLRLFVDYSQIGLYTVGVGLANKIWIIPDAFKDVLFTKTAQKDSLKDITFSIKFNLYISLLIIFFVILFGKGLIQLLYGIEFLDSYNVMVVIFLGIIPMIFFKLINTLFIATGKQKVSFKILLFSVILNVLGNLFFIPRYGIVGAALASVLSYSFCGGIFVSIFMKQFNLKASEVFFFTKNELERIKKIGKNKR